MKEAGGLDSVPFEEFIRQFVHISQGQVHLLSSFVGFFLVFERHVLACCLLEECIAAETFCCCCLVGLF